MTQTLMRVPCPGLDRGCPAVLEAREVEDLLLAYVAHSHGCMHGAGQVELGEVLDAITVVCVPARSCR